MKYIYVIPAHNEGASIERCLKLLSESEYCRAIYVVDNGSRDDTAAIAKRFPLSFEDTNGPVIKVLSIKSAGIGWAYDAGLRKILSDDLFEPESRIILSAADLPFDFTDVESIDHVGDSKSALSESLYIGSKGCRDSIVPRGPKRRIASIVFYLIRRVLMGLGVKDTQGTIILTVAQARQLVPLIKSRDFFYTTELLFYASKLKIKIVEVPVILSTFTRPSSVRIFHHGKSLLQQSLSICLSHRLKRSS